MGPPAWSKGLAWDWPYTRAPPALRGTWGTSWKGDTLRRVHRGAPRGVAGACPDLAAAVGRWLCCTRAVTRDPCQGWGASSPPPSASVQPRGPGWPSVKLAGAEVGQRTVYCISISRINSAASGRLHLGTGPQRPPRPAPPRCPGHEAALRHGLCLCRGGRRSAGPGTLTLTTRFMSASGARPLHKNLTNRHGNDRYTRVMHSLLVTEAIYSQGARGRPQPPSSGVSFSIF